mgnify:CR=1 FL=1
MKDHSENRTENRTNNCKNQSQNRTTNQTTNEHKHPNQYTKGADDEGAKNTSGRDFMGSSFSFVLRDALNK